MTSWTHNGKPVKVSIFRKGGTVVIHWDDVKVSVVTLEQFGTMGFVRHEA